MQEEGLTAKGQLLDTMFKNCVVVVRYETTVTYPLSTGIKYLLEQGIGESSMIWPVRKDPGTMCVRQALMCFLGLKILHRWGAPNEVVVKLIGVVILKTSGCPKSRMSEWPSDLRGYPWLGRYHLINWVHGPMSVFQGITDCAPCVFDFGNLWPLLVIPK